MKCLKILLCLFFLSNIICAQNESFLVQKFGMIGREIVVNNDDEITAILSKSGSSAAEGIIIVNLSQVDSVQHTDFLRYNHSTASFNILKGIYFREEIIYMSWFNHFFQPTILAYNINTKEYWMKAIYATNFDFALNYSQGRIGLIKNLGVNLIADGFKLIMLDDQTGESIDSVAYSLIKPDADYFVTRDLRIQYEDGGSYYVSGIFANIDSTGNDETFIVQLDENGGVLNKTSFGGNHRSEDILVNENGVYVFGKTKAEAPYDGNNENLFLAKFNLDLSFDWAKIFYAESFEYREASLTLGNDGSLTLGYSTDGFFPTILSKLDEEGNILWQKGYPMYQPELDVLSDGSLLMMSNVWDGVDISSFNAQFARTDTLGEIEGCYTLPTCLFSENIELNLEDFDLNEIPFELEYGNPLELIIDSMEFSFSEFCDFPPEPVPDFFLPDTICVNDSLTINPDGNIYANSNQWHLSGNGLDSIWQDSLEFRFRFYEPGDYMVSQTIWYLGCAHSTTEDIVVLPNLELEINISEEPCEPPIDLRLNSNRILSEMEWETGETTESIKIWDEGNYKAIASDGYCDASTELEMSFVSSVFGAAPPIVLPDDVVHCSEEWPYLLFPESVFSNQYYLNGSQQNGLPIEIEAEGEYDVSIKVDGCMFSEKFILTEENCEAKVYFPNTFSPNGDGVNDIFFPQGENFTPISLSVYHRWGGLVFYSEGPLPSWSGKDAQNGVYVYLFEYMDQHSGAMQKIYGDVLVVR